MAMKAGRVGVNPASVDELGNITSGGLTPEERAKLEKALVSPVTTPTEKEIVGVGTANEQIMFKVGSGLVIEGETSPFTLKSGGAGGLTKVWENATPGSAWTRSTIEGITGLSAGDIICIDFIVESSSRNHIFSWFTVENNSGYVVNSTNLYTNTKPVKHYQRSGKFNTPNDFTELTISAAWGTDFTDTTPTADNSKLIPYRIYKI